MTWKDAQAYVHWLSLRTRHQYRLLTEAEWEYAARAGTTTAYPWGLKGSHEHTNYGAENWGGLTVGRDHWFYTSPVGSFASNGFGLYDMHGNVLQWVEDCFAKDYADLPSDSSAYVAVVQLETAGDFAYMNATSSCSYRRLRGGDWGRSRVEGAICGTQLGPASQLDSQRLPERRGRLSSGHESELVRMVANPLFTNPPYSVSATRESSAGRTVPGLRGRLPEARWGSLSLTVSPRCQASLSAPAVRPGVTLVGVPRVDLRLPNPYNSCSRSGFWHVYRYASGKNG